MDYLFIAILIVSLVSTIFFTWRVIQKRNWINLLGLIISLIPLVVVATFFWLVIIKPYKQLHSDDHLYFGNYVFLKTEGAKNIPVSKSSQLTLHPDFTYTLIDFNEPGFPKKGKWQSCWTDDCMFGFNYDQSIRFYGIPEEDSTKVTLKLLKKAGAGTFFFFRKAK